MNAYEQGKQAYCQYSADLAHNCDNPYCKDDPRYAEFENGVMAARDNEQVAIN